MNERETLTINNNHLIIGGCDAVSLVEKYKTPLYVMDEAYIRKMCRVYKNTIEKEYGDGIALYASKAFSCTAVYKIANSEGLGVDVVSAGELYTALKAGFPSEKIYMHGNNKLDDELTYAIDNNIGRIVADSYSEIDFIDEYCEKKGIVQKVLLRINPGVEAHTHHYIQTARIDSKFGFSISNGEAMKIVKYVLSKKNVKLVGIHCHIGSQIFEKKPFALAVDIMTDFLLEIKRECNTELDELNMGGGFGIWYTDDDRKISAEEYSEYLITITDELKKCVADKKLKKPKLIIEPGRSIVGEAGVTLYTVGAVKSIPNIKNYLAIDGGMFDNPRYALYEAKYSAALANRMNDEKTCVYTISGKCCESGDIIAQDVKLPVSHKGDIVAIFSTGAYNYSMSSNYNRNKVPPVVLVNEGKSDYIVKPQTYDDIIRNDVIPEKLL